VGKKLIYVHLHCIPVSQIWKFGFFFFFFFKGPVSLSSGDAYVCRWDGKWWMDSVKGVQMIFDIGSEFERSISGSNAFKHNRT